MCLGPVLSHGSLFARWIMSARPKQEGVSGFSSEGRIRKSALSCSACHESSLAVVPPAAVNQEEQDNGKETYLGGARPNQRMRVLDSQGATAGLGQGQSGDKQKHSDWDFPR